MKAHRRLRTHSRQAKAVANARMSAQKISLVWGLVQGLVQGSWQGTRLRLSQWSLAMNPELNPKLN